MNEIAKYALLLGTLLWGSFSIAQTHNDIDEIVADTTACQECIVDTTTSCPGDSLLLIEHISCVNIEADTITFNGADWSSLFDAMQQLQDSTHDATRRVVSIIHLGDSHVQAGYFTEALRLPMQQRWGNAGRGLITPLRICKTNEPADYRITSPDKWQYKRCIIGKKFSNSVGVSGILIEPASQYIDLTFETMSRYGEDVGFNTLRLFHATSNHFPQLIPAITPEGLETFTPQPGETCYRWTHTQNTIQLQGANSYKEESAAIYGASLENGKSGIIVHTIGNNSATYECYNRVEEYGKKIAPLAPHLVIISLGTNESVSNATTHEGVYQQIDQLISSIKAHSSNTLFLLTTPADNKLRKRGRRKNGRRTTHYVENALIATVTEAIKAYGKEHNIAVWDWYTIGGGKGSCETWIDEKGMRNDHIHYTPKGYALQGNLLYHSILNAYEEYIR